MAEFMPLKQETEKRVAALKPASDKKSQPELCAAFRNLVTAHTKMVKYAEEHAADCRHTARRHQEDAGQERQDLQSAQQSLRCRRRPPRRRRQA